MRVGIGYDFHLLVPGDHLVIGGEHISYSKAILGHSDGDVLIHAVIDALLGAAGLGDIGEHFPPGDASLAGISSMLLLERTAALIVEAGYLVANIDSTVVLQEPRLLPYRDAMRGNLAETLSLEIGSVSVKAKTKEGADAVGEGRGVEAHAVVLLQDSDGPPAWV